MQLTDSLAKTEADEPPHQLADVHLRLRAQNDLFSDLQAKLQAKLVECDSRNNLLSHKVVTQNHQLASAEQLARDAVMNLANATKENEALRSALRQHESNQVEQNVALQNAQKQYELS